MPEAASLGLTAPQAWLLLPLFLHFGLVVGLYAALTWARLVAVRGGEAAKDDSVVHRIGIDTRPAESRVNKAMRRKIVRHPSACVSKTCFGKLA